jgi:hypothetical protein
MPTEYSSAQDEYIQKQRRWIRNVFVLGARYHSSGEVLRVLPTLALPYLLLAALVLSIVRPFFLRAVLVIIAHAVLNRVRYLHRADLQLSIGACLRHFVAAQTAAAQAGMDILAQRQPW